MKSIAIYVEGGFTAQQKAELRVGFDQLLAVEKRAAQIKRLRSKTAFSGSRQLTYKAFVNEIEQSDDETLCILLVDSEKETLPETEKPKKESPEEEQQRKRADAIERKDFLISIDRWNLEDIDPESIHLMVQCMESWIVADPERLAAYYGKNFHTKSLPTRINLEDEPKDNIYRKLGDATKKTKKGEYKKIDHAAQLLGLIDRKKVAVRCPRFATFTSWLLEQIDAA